VKNYAAAGLCAAGFLVLSLPGAAQTQAATHASKNKAVERRPRPSAAEKERLTSVVRHLMENAAVTSEETLKALDAECTRAAIQANVEALVLLESDDFTFTSPDGSIMTKAQDLDTLRAGDLYYESISLDDVSVRAYKESGVVTGRATVKGWYKTFEISGAYRYTVMFARLNGKWRVVASQMTRIQG